MSIENWRIEIDEIDTAILRLLENRAQIVMAIGAAKAKAGLPIIDAERERLVLHKVSSLKSETFSAEAAECVFRCIIGESRRIQTEILRRQTQSVEIC